MSVARVLYHSRHAARAIGHEELEDLQILDSTVTGAWSNQLSAGGIQPLEATHLRRSCHESAASADSAMTHVSIVVEQNRQPVTIRILA